MAEEKSPLKWKFETDSGSLGGGDAVSDGVVYFGSSDKHLYALDAKTGEEKWKFETGSYVQSSPAVVDGVVYFGSDDKHLYALDSKTGEEKWKFKTGKGVTSSPAVVDGVVYFGSDDNHLYAVDIEKYSEMLAPIKVNGDLSQKNIKSKDTLNKSAPTDKKFITCYHDDLFYEDIGDNFQREDTIVVLENLGDVYEFAEIENREEARDFYNSQITSNFFELGYTDYGNWEELETIVGEEELKALRKTYFDCDDFAETTWTILLYHDNKFVTILRD